MHIRKKTLSVLLDPEIYFFIEKEAQDQKTTKTHIIKEMLDGYRKYKLQKSIEEGFKNQTEEDREMADWGMADYFEIIDKT